MPIEDFTHEGYRLQCYMEEHHGAVGQISEIIGLGRHSMYLLYGKSHLKKEHKEALRAAGLKIKGVTEPLVLQEVNDNAKDSEIAMLKQRLKDKEQTIEALKEALKALKD